MWLTRKPAFGNILHSEIRIVEIFFKKSNKPLNKSIPISYIFFLFECLYFTFQLIKNFIDDCVQLMTELAQKASLN